MATIIYTLLVAGLALFAFAMPFAMAWAKDPDDDVPFAFMGGVATAGIALVVAALVGLVIVGIISL